MHELTVTEPAARPVHRPGRGPGRRPRWTIAAIVVAGWLLHLGWRLWLARTVDAPAGHPDEDGYLLAARALAGGPGGYSTENGPFRRVGYPLLLTPIYWVSGDSFDIFRRAQVVGAVFGASVFALAAVFARRVLALPRRWALGLAFAVAALPAVAFYSALAMTDAVLPALFLLWLVLAHGWLVATSPGRRWLYAVGAGAAAGFVHTVHVRGTMIAVVHVLLVVVVVLRRRGGLRLGAGSVAATVAVGATNVLLTRVLGDSIALIGGDPATQLGTALSVGWGVGLVVLRVLGQLWYLGVGTLGLGMVGLLAAARPLAGRARSRDRPAGDGGADTARDLVLGAALAATALIAVGSAASLPFGEHRVTYFAYPRYLHFAYPVWFMVGLATIRAAEPRLRLRWAGVAAGSLVAAAAVVRWRTAQAGSGPFVAFDAPETTLMSWQWSHFPVLVPTVVALCVFAAVVLAQARGRTAAAALAAVTVLCGLGMPVIQHRVIEPMVDPQYAGDTPRLVRDLHLGPGDRVAEAWQVRYPDLFNHMREVSWQRLVFFDANQPPPPDANVVIAPWDPWGRGPSWDGTAFGMGFVAGAPRQGWAVWRRGPPGS